MHLTFEFNTAAHCKLCWQCCEISKWENYWEKNLKLVGNSLAKQIVECSCGCGMGISATETNCRQKFIMWIAALPVLLTFELSIIIINSSNKMINMPIIISIALGGLRVSGTFPWHIINNIVHKTTKWKLGTHKISMKALLGFMKTATADGCTNPELDPQRRQNTKSAGSGRCLCIIWKGSPGGLPRGQLAGSLRFVA